MTATRPPVEELLDMRRLREALITVAGTYHEPGGKGHQQDRSGDYENPDDFRDCDDWACRTASDALASPDAATPERLTEESPR